MSNKNSWKQCELSTNNVHGKECLCKERSHVKEARTQVVSNVNLKKPTFIQVALKNLYFNVAYYSDYHVWCTIE